MNTYLEQRLERTKTQLDKRNVPSRKRRKFERQYVRYMRAYDRTDPGARSEEFMNWWQHYAMSNFYKSEIHGG